MFVLASLFYVLLSGGFTTIELKNKAYKLISTSSVSSSKRRRSGEVEITIDRATLLRMRPTTGASRQGAPALRASTTFDANKNQDDRSSQSPQRQRRKQNVKAKQPLQQSQDDRSSQSPTSSFGPVAKSARTLAEAPSPVVVPSAAPMLVQEPDVTDSSPKPFDAPAFRRELSATLKELAMDRKTGVAVQRIRAMQVPTERQADEFADLLTRIAEENRGAVRFAYVAFVAGLTANGRGPWSREECLRGISMFFQDIYADLCDEIPKLPRIVTVEFLPTLYSVLPSEELDLVVPDEVRAIMQN